MPDVVGLVLAMVGTTIGVLLIDTTIDYLTDRLSGKN